MRKIFLISSVLFLLSFSAFAQTIRLGVEDNQIKIGVVDSIYSEILGELRPIWISIPRSAEDPHKRFPVLYVLDANAHFYSLVGMIHQLSVANGNAIIPEMIIVAIPNVNRVRDLTPSEVSYFPNSGKAENFTSFIEKELIPFIDGKYPTTPYRTLFGHSWGGLFVVNTLVHHPELFDNYITIDPGIRWDNLSFFREVSQLLENETFANKSLYLAVSNRIPKGLDLSSVVKDTLKSSEHMRTILQFSKTCSETSGLNFNWNFYENDNHNGVPFIGGYDAFRFLFEWYNFNEEIFFQEGLNMSVQELMDLVTRHFENISNHFGYAFLPPEMLINRYGDIMMSEDQYDKAFAFYDMNINNYPESFRVYDAMGDFYRTQAKNEKAIPFYKRSLEIEEIESVRRKLSNSSESN